MGGHASALPTRRRFCLALAGLAALAGCGSVPLPFGLGATPTPSPPPLSGTLVLARAGDLYRFDLATDDETQIHHVAPGTSATSPAISPDRKQIAYTYYAPADLPTGLGRTSLYVIGATGANPEKVATPADDGGSYEDPSWAPDGRTIYATLRSPVVSQGRLVSVQTAVVRVGFIGADPIRIAENAQSPSASPDGQRLVYLTANAKGTLVHLVVSDADGKNAIDVVANRGFSALLNPRFSPDGRWIAFAGAGGPSQTADFVVPARGSTIPGLFSPGVAEADGIPAEIWIVQPNGAGLRRLTNVQQHSPIPAWSPDGKWIAFLGETGLFVVDASGGHTSQIKAANGSAGISWTS